MHNVTCTRIVQRSLAPYELCLRDYGPTLIPMTYVEMPPKPATDLYGWALFGFCQGFRSKQFQCSVMDQDSRILQRVLPGYKVFQKRNCTCHEPLSAASNL